ncbi:flagellar hook-associated protein FlgK [Helicobacter sp. faydin-H20]|uniref:flagellar hook-associated protein FlgK n=1 Tax=Helicobacter anatolicus TaxID=2905874 RepID=UPI001E59D38E|nr:flagellar hook-associated protein FlgK [Helicobacter anatolicus]MCE3036502.1 flagellar hook-associated protein FlgK [Helicobacter anatolicus]
MGGILTSLNTSYTGLQAHQLMVDVTGNNISNASDEFYSRQRVVAYPEKPLVLGNNVVGRGVDVQSIQRIHNEFVFDRYAKAAQDFNFADTEFNHLREASSLFPDVDGVGLYNDLKEYFNAWKDLSKSSNDSAQKQVLAEKTRIFTRHLQDVREKLSTLQRKASEDLEVRIKEVNDIGAQIVNLNKEIKKLEDNQAYKRANTLRDRRDQLEFNLRELIGANVYKSKLQSQGKVDRDSVDFEEEYVLNIGNGLNIIDGTSFHPIVLDKEKNSNYLNRLYLQGYDFKQVEITDKITQGKIGALIDLYNDGHNGTKVGKFQHYIDLLDSFAKGFIEASNAIYAQSATQRIESSPLQIEDDVAFRDSEYNIKNGSFDIIVYSTDGDIVAKKTIEVNEITTMGSVVKQINANTDDNRDNNAQNDVNNFFKAYYDNETKKLLVQPLKEAEGFFIAIKDNGTNFPGATGINKFLEGDSAENISLNYLYQKDATAIRSWLAPVSGNFEIANMMQQMQYDKIEFYKNKSNVNKMKLSEFYQFAAGKVATDTQGAQVTLDTKKAVLETAKKEHLAISQVSIDEEMVNLIKFQGGYAANAKVITAIDRMIDTLLSIKQ